MRFDHTHYVPCLRWKRGEYLAVRQLSETIKCAFTPLIEIPEIGWDFEKETEAKTIDEHLAPLAKRIYEKWGRQFCFVDLHLIGSNERMATGIHPVCFVFDGLRERKCLAIPVTGLDRNNAYQQEVKTTLNKDKNGVCLRISIGQDTKGSLKSEFDSLLSRLKVKPKSCDLIIDLGAPNFVPPEGFSKAIQAIMRTFPYLYEWRTFTLLGTSFPETMAGIKKGGNIVPRLEWLLYKLLVVNFQKAGLRIPAFGDYAINHPKVLEKDMRMLKPFVTIRYTIDNGWYIVRGENYKDFGLKQYHELSRQILDSKYFFGTAFSWGDSYIQECANRSDRPGNLTTWRQVGTSHHIEKVTRDIASFYASLSSP